MRSIECHKEEFYEAVPWFPRSWFQTPLLAWLSTRSNLKSRNWHLIDMDQWYRSELCDRPPPTLTVQLADILLPHSTMLRFSPRGVVYALVHRWYRRNSVMSIWFGELEWWVYLVVEKVWWDAQPYRRNTGMWRTDRQTDRPTDAFIYRS